MGNYRRVFVPGGTYFFTVVTANRRSWLGTLEGRRALAEAMRAVRVDLPFTTVAIVVLPDHLHTLWTLPNGDADFPRRWQRIKHRTTVRMRQLTGLRGALWQPRYWEHLIRDETDFERHFDYIHYNPVKHGLCASPLEWEASTFRRKVAKGIYPSDWAGPPDDFELPE